MQKQPPEVFCKKGVLKNFANFTEKHLCWSPNTGKYGPEKTPYLDTFHAVMVHKHNVMIAISFSKFLYHLYGASTLRAL